MGGRTPLRLVPSKRRSSKTVSFKISLGRVERSWMLPDKINCVIAERTPMSIGIVPARSNDETSQMRVTRPVTQTKRLPSHGPLSEKRGHSTVDVQLTAV
jgi:hypothetical protein